MKEKVIINEINIKRQGERQHFQIKLSSDAKFIIGIEYGVRFINETKEINVASIEKEIPKVELPPTDTNNTGTIKEQSEMLFERNQLIGELKLQSSEESNWFYSTDVFCADANLKYGDVSNVQFSVNDFTHSNKRTEEIVKVNAESTVIQGWYLDKIGATQKANINYKVTIYVWINVEE